MLARYDLVAIDPGQNPGVAYFRAGHLVRVETCVSCALSDVLTVEIPQVYPGTPAGQANDLITLAFTAGRQVAAVQAARVFGVLPRTWKGQVEKSVTQARVAKRLRPDELSLLTGRKHDAWDAVGIGLWALDRLNDGLIPGFRLAAEV